ncbi:hypothetical protein [Acidithiobacillus thiooxidans]|uniref:hypothetical protein n=1 Tax=Acidithiobacillus thiooxidans TaxID=930 RepID=UPI001D001D67|nr:hypothetical protein [Acidithiobacillus thiooxidans]
MSGRRTDRIFSSILRGGRRCLWPRGRYAWWRRCGHWLLLSIILVAVIAWFMPPDTQTLKQGGAHHLRPPRPRVEYVSQSPAAMGFCHARKAGQSGPDPDADRH